MTIEEAVLSGDLRVVSDRMDSVESVSIGIWVNAERGTRTPRITVSLICWNTWLSRVPTAEARLILLPR